MLVQVCARPVPCPHSQQKAWPQRHTTRLHLQGAVEAAAAAAKW